MVLEKYISLEEKSDVFKNHSIINTTQQFCEWYMNYKNQKNLYFRGLNKASYKNYTSAQRLLITHNLQCSPITLIGSQVYLLRKEYNHLYEIYCKLNGILCTDLYIMSIAQHYASGISPLLDVTSDINTALYFMCDKAAFPKEGVADNSINNYASIYFLDNSLEKFENVFDKWLAKVSQSDVKSENELRLICEKEVQTLLAVTFFNMYAGKRPIHINNHPYTKVFTNNGYEYQTTVVFNNLNITAQNGSFIYYENEKEPLESNIYCVDIHKSLIPYISQKYLIPNNKTAKYLFPIPTTIVNDSFEKLLANEQILL